MRWFKNFPWLALILLIATYLVAGWHYAEWVQEIIRNEQIWMWNVKPAIALITLNGLAASIIFFIASIVSTPFDFLNINISWINLKPRAVMPIVFEALFGALAFALIIQRFQYFVRFLVLLAVFLLFKLDFRRAGYSETSSRILLIILSLSSFAGGVASFYFWGSYIKSL